MEAVAAVGGNVDQGNYGSDGEQGREMAAA